MKTSAAALLLTLLGAAAQAQTVAVTDSKHAPRWKAAQGETLTITAAGMTCDAPRTSAAPVVLFDDVNVTIDAQTSAGAWTVTVPSSLAPGAYRVTLTCDKKSAPVWLRVTPATPQVVCAATNAPKPTEKRPKDGRCRPDVPWEVRLGDRIDLEVYALPQLRKAYGDKPLRLFVDGIELKNLELHLSGTDNDAELSTFWTQLDFDHDNPENRKAWVLLMQVARDRRILKVSVGPEGGPEFPTRALTELNVFPTGWAIFTVAAILVLVIATGILAWKSSLLRGPKCAADPAPFSLARHQMAVWFIVVIAAFLFVMLMTGRATTSSTALILIGISGATGLAAVAIDAQQAGQAVTDRDALTAEQTAIEKALDAPDVGLRAQLAKAAPGSTEAAQIAAAIQAKVQRVAEITAALQRPAATGTPSRGWLRDLFSDENGVSFHRLQIIGWTVVLVGVFGRAVWRELAMPDFDTTTLALMGVSSGTYLGFKLPK
jgi:hypothetical protein